MNDKVLTVLIMKDAPENFYAIERLGSKLSKGQLSPIMLDGDTLQIWYAKDMKFVRNAAKRFNKTICVVLDKPMGKKVDPLKYVSKSFQDLADEIWVQKENMLDCIKGSPLFLISID
jgi:hypothetical protein